MNHHDVIERCDGCADWIMAVLIAAFLNIILFGLMPALVRMSPQNQDLHDKLNSVQIIMARHLQIPHKTKKTSSVNHNKIIFKNSMKVFKQKNPEFRFKPAFNEKPKFILEHALSSTASGHISLPMMNFTMTGPALKGQYQIGELDSPLIPIVRIPPLYPAIAMRNNIEGFVKVRFLVTNKGHVKNIHILKAVPEKIFNNSVIRCVSRWEFKPGTVGGIPVNTMAETTIKFKLEQ